MDLAVETPARCSVYRRRRPERTPLYRAVQDHVETYLALAREGHDDGEGVPGYVEGEFRRYLECGILAHGFARARCGECGHDFLIAFSCKGRGVCPSCNARRMAETAAHLVDQVFPPLPVRQWVLSVPKRLRYFLQRDSEALGAVLHILLRVIEARLRQRSGCPGGRLGAVSFVQRFGSALNAHVHFHCCVIDGVIAVGEDGQVHFAEAAALAPEDLAAVQQQVRARVLRWFARAGHLDPADARDMAGWHHGGGFSLDASVKIEGPDRSGLERLLRYCARPPFALERLEQLGDDQLVYRFAKPLPDGRTELRLTPLELIERLAALIPPPRIHRHRYHGVLAPNAPLRAQVTALAPQPPAPLPEAAHAPHAPARSPARYLWAALLARIYEILPLLCPYCAGPVRIIAFLTEPASVNALLSHLGEPTAAPEVAPARGPPLWEQAAQSHWDDTPAPAPEYVFDQRLSW
jgi:hypothetical protein